jgi:hypothetical protein
LSDDDDDDGKCGVGDAWPSAHVRRKKRKLNAASNDRTRNRRLLDFEYGFKSYNEDDYFSSPPMSEAATVDYQKNLQFDLSSSDEAEVLVERVVKKKRTIDGLDDASDDSSCMCLN